MFSILRSLAACSSSVLHGVVSLPVIRGARVDCGPPIESEDDGIPAIPLQPKLNILSPLPQHYLPERHDILQNDLHEDAMIAATAEMHSLIVVTRNVRDFAQLGVRTLNPFESV